MPIRTRTTAPSGHACSAERALRVDRRGDRVLRARERDEERVALRVDLAAAVRVERRAQQPPVVGEHLAVAVAQLLEQRASIPRCR